MVSSRRLFSHWIPVLLWCSVIFYFSSIPDLGTGWGVYDFVFRKLAHMAEYGILAVLVWRAWGDGRPGVFFVALIFSVLYAASDEWHQGFVPGRTPSPWDVCIDAAGALAACLWQRRAGGNLLDGGWRWARSRVFSS